MQRRYRNFTLIAALVAFSVIIFVPMQGMAAELLSPKATIADSTFQVTWHNIFVQQTAAAITESTIAENIKRLLSNEVNAATMNLTFLGMGNDYCTSLNIVVDAQGKIIAMGENAIETDVQEKINAHEYARVFITINDVRRYSRNSPRFIFRDFTQSGLTPDAQKILAESLTRANERMLTPTVRCPIEYFRNDTKTIPDTDEIFVFAGRGVYRFWIEGLTAYFQQYDAAATHPIGERFFVFINEPVRIGRDPNWNTHVISGDNQLSRQHFQVIVKETRSGFVFELTDFGSTNMTGGFYYAAVLPETARGEPDFPTIEPLLEESHTPAIAAAVVSSI
ncbi:MAG: FHA domain-containing protein [Candidatus Omnitrophica bacterium]|nr:FHA domain-containing protein [Candidatus Omnitrophota bacterium]